MKAETGVGGGGRLHCLTGQLPPEIGEAAYHSPWYIRTLYYSGIEKGDGGDTYSL